MSQDWNGIQQGNSKHKAEIIQVGLTHSLATQYTSFVAVEEKTVVRDGKPVRIEVPVELPQGVSPLAVPGRQYDREVISAKLLRAPMVAGGSSAGYAYHALSPPPPMPAPTSVPNASVAITIAPAIETTTDAPKPTVHKRYIFKLSNKLSPELMVIYNCTFPLGNPATKGCKPQPSLLKVVVMLTRADSTLEPRLATAGFTLDSGSGTKVLTGTVAPSKLTDLAGIPEVKYISLTK
jgi:hypothetical protein